MSFWRKEVIQPALDYDVEAAIAEQKAILARDPNSVRAHFALGTLLQFKGEAEATIDHFLKAIEAGSNCAAPHVSLGRIYAVHGNDDTRGQSGTDRTSHPLPKCIIRLAVSGV